MSVWVLAAIVVLGGALAAGPTVWSWLDPLSPARAAGRLREVISSWNAIRDFDAERVHVGGPAGEVELGLKFLSPSNFRLEVMAPPSIAGHVFTLRPVGSDWLLVHHRPELDAGVEVRIRAHELQSEPLLSTPGAVVDAVRRGQIRVAYRPAPPGNATVSDTFDIDRLPGQFPRIVLAVDPQTLLPRELALYEDPLASPSVVVQVGTLRVNAGLELRDILRLEILPSRWIAPSPSQ